MPHASTDVSRVLVAGNPNAGKSTLFNAITGARARVGNYPGITVELLEHDVTYAGERLRVVDLPGTYSLTACSLDEDVANTALRDASVRAVIVVVDATAMERGLYLAVQVREIGVPMVIALNMIDAFDAFGASVDLDVFRKAFDCPVVALAAAHRRGLDELERAVGDVLKGDGASTALSLPFSSAVNRATSTVERAWTSMGEREENDSESSPRTRSMARWLLLSEGESEGRAVPAVVRSSVQSAYSDYDGEVPLDEAIIATRYSWITEQVGRAVRWPKSPGPTWTDRLDSVLTHRVFGVVAFFGVMLLVFETLFRWAEPMMQVIESVVAMAQGAVIVAMGPSIVRDMLVHGVLGGVGNVIVFVPQIVLLFLLIAALEDSGYLARAAFVIDRVMTAAGLHGKAFVPLLSGFACAVPAVMATRTIEDRRSRIVTMLALPLMSCSARLPVYLLVVGTVFGTATTFGGLNLGALALFAMYLLSVVFSLLAAMVLRHTVLQGPTPSFVLELPPYRWPKVSSLWLTAWRRLKAFLVEAGTIILAFSLILWAALSFPRSADVTEAYRIQESELRVAYKTTLATSAPPEQSLGEALVALDRRQSAEQLPLSLAAKFGHWAEPALRPLGFDWRIGVAIFGAFAAREVFVSTLGMVFGLEEDDEQSPSMRRAVRDARWPDGSRLMTVASGLSLMVFFLLACQCMSTIAAVRRESGSWKWPALMFTYMTVLAYVCAWVTHQVVGAIT